MSADIHDVITCATFFDDRLRVWGWQGVELPDRVRDRVRVRLVRVRVRVGEGGLEWRSRN